MIVTSPDELRAIVRAAVEEALATRAANGPPSGEWIDTGAAAALLGVSTRQVAKLAASSRGRPALLASTRVGRLLRFRRADVLALLSGPAR